MPISKKTREAKTCSCGVPWCDGNHSAITKLAARIAAINSNGRQWEVTGSKGVKYTVRHHFVDSGWTCTCPAFGFGRGSMCKHIQDIQIAEGQQNAGNE